MKNIDFLSILPQKLNETSQFVFVFGEKRWRQGGSIRLAFLRVTFTSENFTPGSMKFDKFDAV